MRALTMLILALCATTGPAMAGDYDYIRGDDIYHDNYDYGLHYDRLTSRPHQDRDQTDPAPARPGRKLKSHVAPPSGGAGRFPNMDAEMRQFRQHALGRADAMDNGLGNGMAAGIERDPNEGLGGVLDADTNPYSHLDLQSNLHRDIKKLSEPGE